MGKLHNGSEIIRPLTYLAPPPRRSDMPRSIDFSSNDKTKLKGGSINKEDITLDSKNKNSIVEDDKNKNDKETKSYMDEEHNEEDYDDKIIQSYMSETPENIDKLKAMMLESKDSKHQNENQEQSSNQYQSSPVYII